MPIKVDFFDETFIITLHIAKKSFREGVYMNSNKMLRICIGIIVVCSVVIVANGYIKIKNIKDQRQVVMGEFIQLEDDLKELKLQLDTVQSDEFVEKTAREELGLVKPGEQLIILAEPNVGGFDTTPRKDLNIEIGD